MLVLGIDPGSRFLGYGLVDWRANKATHVASGVVRADGKLLKASKCRDAD